MQAKRAVDRGHQQTQQPISLHLPKRSRKNSQATIQLPAQRQSQTRNLSKPNSRVVLGRGSRSSIHSKEGGGSLKKKSLVAQQSSRKLPKLIQIDLKSCVVPSERTLSLGNRLGSSHPTLPAATPVLKK